MKKSFWSDRNYIFLLILIFCAAEIIINPIGEFPLNDDWSYTRTLEHLYHTGQVRPGGFTSMPLVTQLYWALGFCKIFGLAFTTIRFSTIILGLICVISTYLLSREFSENRKIAFLSALILAFNPIFLNLSNTFMTDVPFLGFLLPGLLLFVKGLKNNKSSTIAIAILLVLLATMVRQLGLLGALAFAITYAYHKRNIRAFVVAALAFGIPLSIYFLYGFWLRQQGSYPIMYDEGTKQIAYHLLHSDESVFLFVARQSLIILIYIGFTLFPLLFIFKLRQLFIFCLVGLALVIAFSMATGNLMPLMGNVITPFGLGIIAMRDVMILKQADVAVLPKWIWIAMTAAAGMGIGIILLGLVNLLRSYKQWLGKQKPELLFLILFATTYAATIIVGGAFDRYLLPLIPVILAILSNISKELVLTRKPGFMVALLFTSIYAFFSVVFTADYLSWNRARWKGLNELMISENISPSRIDGGFEFNGYYLYDNTMMQFHDDPQRKSWWWVIDDEYLVSLGPIPNYKTYKVYNYPRLLHFKTGYVYILKRIKD